MIGRRRAIGIDFGAEAIKAVLVRESAGTIEVERAIVIPRARLASEGVDLEDPADVAAAVARVISEEGFRVRSGILGLDGAESILRYTHVPPMPDRRLETVISYEVLSIADRMGEPVASDFAILPVPRLDGERTILIGLAKETALDAKLSALEAGGIRIESCVPAALALYSAWDFFAEKAPPDGEEDDAVLAIDIGARNLHMLVILDNRLVFARSATFGGERFTEALERSLGLSRAEAEAVKRRRGGLDASRPGVAEATVGPLRGAAGQLLSNLQSTLRFVSSQADVELPPLRRVWMTGGGARLNGLDTWLAQALGAEKVESFAPASTESGAEKTDASLGLAVGLATVALRARGKRDAALEILPSAYRKRRIFRERTVFLWAAGILLGLSLVLRLAHGLWVSADANSLHEELQNEWAALESRRAERDASIAESRAIRARIDRLLEEAEPTSFQAFLLHFLGDSLRSEIRLDSVVLEAEEKGGEGGFAYEAIVKGRVSNEKRKGFDWILELQDSLLREERVRDVQFLSHEEEGPWYTFTMAVRPESGRM
ncbi:MAG TPA: pilus assembly protein PilM [Planctomycetota bacterium]|nr:pilus assembly protein PilM [Planctomycetota bacterium]